MNIRRITTFAFVLAIAALIVGLSACDRAITELDFLLSGGDAPQMEGVSGEIPVGVVLPLTGQFGESYGVPMSQGFELALHEINAVQIDATITLITEDSQHTPEGAVEAFGKLIHEDGVTVILGPTFSRQAEEAFPLARQHGVVAFSPTSSQSGLNEYDDVIFRAGLTTDVLIPPGVRVTQEKLGYTKVATIYDIGDSYSTNGHEVLVEALANHNVEILTTETFETGDAGFSAQLTKIMESNPEAIFVSALSVEMAEILIQGRPLIPFSVPFIIPELTIDEVRKAGLAAAGAITFIGWDSSAETPGNEAFVAKYKAMYGTEPNAWAAQSYATLHILAEAIRNAQSTDSMAIRDALANIMVETVLGEFSFGPSGDAVYNPLILKVKVPETEAALTPFE